MARIPIVNEQFYHVYNRGVLQQPIFLEDRDYLHFVENLHKFNSSKIRSREPLVVILAWCLMPNHFHLFLKQLQDGGLSLFMQRLEIGHTMHMNKKYKRSGYLLQGKYQSKLIEQDAHLFHISRYIHLNPLDLFEPDWETRGVSNVGKAMDFIEAYRWSSFQSWLNGNRFPEVVEKQSIDNFVAHLGDYRKFVRDRISGDPISTKLVARDNLAAP